MRHSRLLVVVAAAMVFAFPPTASARKPSGSHAARHASSASKGTGSSKGHASGPKAAKPHAPKAAKAPKPPKQSATKPATNSTTRDERGRLQRSAAARHAFARQTGFPNGRPGYVIDHIKPLACGGADAPSNMQWQTIAEAKAKDRVERVGCR